MFEPGWIFYAAIFIFALVICFAILSFGRQRPSMQNSAHTYLQRIKGWPKARNRNPSEVDD
ncbi:hypothetical protein [Hoeflea sp.]|uniref:hypothetical protein n=1 Tax=Hoeflea sp. TaxID=1940281 RepID=UPI003B52CB9D